MSGKMGPIPADPARRYERRDRAYKNYHMKWLLVCSLAIVLGAIVGATCAQAHGPKAGGNERRAAAWICCDGEDGFQICWRSDISPWAATSECLRQHEDAHIKYLKDNYPDLCVGKKERFHLPWPTAKDAIIGECEGYQIQARCMMRRRNGPRYYRLINKFASELYSCDFRFPNGVNPELVRQLEEGQEVKDGRPPKGSRDEDH